MAAAFVQATLIVAGSGATFGGSVTPTAGNALICPCQGATNNGTTSIPSVSDNSGSNTWTSDASGTLSLTGLPGGVACCSAPNVASGTYTVTINTNAATHGLGGSSSVYEFSGMATSSMHDATSPAVKTGTGTSASTNTLTNTNADAVFIGQVSTDLGSGTSAMTGTTSGWVYPANGKETSAAANWIFGSGYHIVSGVTTDSSAWTITSAHWAGLITAYKAAAGAATAVLRPTIFLPPFNLALFE